MSSGADITVEATKLHLLRAQLRAKPTKRLKRNAGIRDEAEVDCNFHPVLYSTLRAKLRALQLNYQITAEPHHGRSDRLPIPLPRCPTHTHPNEYSKLRAWNQNPQTSFKLGIINTSFTTKVEFVGGDVSMMKPQIDSPKTKRDDDDNFFSKTC